MTTATGTPPPDHRIGDTEHGTLYFADGTVTVIADWRIIEEAPDPEGRIYRTLRGFTVNRPHGPLSETPFPEGETRLARADLRGTPLVDTDVVCRLTYLTAPEPNTWDHPGYVLSVRWLDRNVNPLWWPRVLDSFRENEAEVAGIWKALRESDDEAEKEAARAMGEPPAELTPLLQRARPVLEGGTLWLGLSAERAREFTQNDGERTLRLFLPTFRTLGYGGRLSASTMVTRIEPGPITRGPVADPQPEQSSPADEVLEKIADLKGRFADGYTPEDISTVFARIEEAGGPALVCAWEYLDENGFGGNSEFYVIGADGDGDLHEISPDVYRWLSGEQDSPGPVDSWACARLTPTPTFPAQDGFFHNCARTRA